MKNYLNNSLSHFKGNRIIGWVSVLTLAACVVFSGTADGGQVGQTTGSDKDKDKTGQTTGAPPAQVPTVVSGGGSGDKGAGPSAPPNGGVSGVGQPVNPVVANPAQIPGTQGTGGSVIVVGGAQNGGNGGNQNQAPQLPIIPASEVAKILSKHKFSGAKDLPFFGYSYFESARTGIEQRLATINDPKYKLNIDATASPVGPGISGAAVLNVPYPDRYQLGPGDSFTMRVSSPTQDPETKDIVVDNVGAVTIPQTGAKVVVRGQTLAQLEHTITAAVRLGVRDAQVTLQMKELRTMPIYILGAAYAPGTYTVPSVMSLFNALYIAGGPNENGSMRRIQVKRLNGFVREFDLYQLLVDGDRQQDVPLQPGDVINILPVGDRIVFEGDVRSPAIYELRPGEHLKDLLKWSRGVKPTGVAQKISIEMTKSGNERILLDVDATSTQQSNNPVLHDGDDVNVYSIRPQLTNEVTIEGPVDQPHHYGLSASLATVADLIDASRGLLPEAYDERADLFRKNPDLTHTLIRIDLKRAMARKPEANVKLQEDDRLVIYRTSDVMWMGDRQVVVKGAVNRAGTFYRADSLAVRDILLQAGGLAPDAYEAMAFLQRTNADGTVGPLFKLNLRRAMHGLPGDNILLQDRDILTVFNIKDAVFIADQSVAIKGPIDKPGVFPLSPSMTTRDLLLLAGHLLPTAYTDTAVLRRTNLDGTPGPILKFNVLKALSGDPGNNVELKSKDVVEIYTEAEASFQPELTVSIKGAVQRPGAFPLHENMHVRDVLILAGNVLPTAHLEHGFIQRTNLDGTPGPILTFNVSRALVGVEADNLLLQTKDAISIYTIEQEQYQQKQIVDVAGAVQVPSQYVLSKGMRIHDLLALAGNVLPTAYTERAFLQRVNPDGTFGVLKIINLEKAAVGDPANDIELAPGDKLNVYTKAETNFTPKQTVSISGAVQKPGEYPRADGMTMQDLLRLAGGQTARASDRIELAKSRSPIGSPVQRFALAEMMGPAGLSVKLEDGDLVAVPEDARIMLEPIKISVSGLVGNPGPYLVTSRTERLSTVLKRAGGLLQDAFIKGATFTRNPALLTTDPQRALAPRVLAVLKAVQEDEYKRALARSDIDKLKAITDAQKQGQPSVGLSSSGQVTPTTSAPVAGANTLGSRDAVTAARPLGVADLEPSGNVNINLANVLNHPGCNDDVIVRDGDMLFIPPTPISVSVTGAVISPTAVKFVPGQSLSYYITHSGGFTNDAAKDLIVVIRSSGSIIRASMKMKLELGDTVFIPTMVEADHLHDKGADFTNNLAQITNAGLLIAVVHALLK